MEGEIGVLHLQCIQFIEMAGAGGYLGASQKQGIDQCFAYSVTAAGDDHHLVIVKGHIYTYKAKVQ
jgi:hypothetical protein